MDKNQFFKKDALRPTVEQRLQTKPFYQNANLIYRRYDDWKDSDRFFFIPLYMEMTYCIGGIATELAPDPVWLGSFVQTTLSHPSLFQFKCPKCGAPILPYRYVGSPLSGRVDLEGQCDCGWKGFEMTSGWFIRGEALREQIAADAARYRRYRILHPLSEPETVGQLIRFLEEGKL